MFLAAPSCCGYDRRRADRWLTCLAVDPREAGITREQIRLYLERDDIESRPASKPTHLQPVFRGCRVPDGSVSEQLFEQGLCLPSGSGLTDSDRDRVISAVLDLF